MVYTSILLFPSRSDDRLQRQAAQLPVYLERPLDHTRHGRGSQTDVDLLLGIAEVSRFIRL